MATQKIIRYFLISVMVLLIAGLGAWYFFLNSQGKAVSDNDAARGYGTDVPAYGNETGSTYGNIVAGISSLLGGKTSENGPTKPPRLWQITRTPVAGMGFVGNASSSRLLFAERSTGNILAADPETGAVERLTNRLFPKVYEAMFDREGGVILRSLNESGAITSFAGAIASSSLSFTTESTGAAPLAGKYLENNISGIALGGGSREIFYLLRAPSGDAAGIRAQSDGSKPEKVFSSPLSNWKPVFLSDKRIFLVLKPSDNIPGYAYELKNEGSLSSVMRAVPGLTYLPKAFSEAAIIGLSANGTVRLFLHPENNGEEKSLPLKTVADKCVWSPREPVAYCAVPESIVTKNFLDDWYKGIVHTSDSWWRIEANDGKVEFLFSADEPGQKFDVENPTIDEQGKTISFINAADKTLWLLRIDRDS